MKRLLALLFTLVVAFSLTMPVFAQEAAAGEAAPKAEKKKKAPKVKKPKAEKAKKAPKAPKEAPPTQ
jgi:hypothetical protein